MFQLQDSSVGNHTKTFPLYVQKFCCWVFWCQRPNIVNGFHSFVLLINTWLVPYCSVWPRLNSLSHPLLKQFWKLISAMQPNISLYRRIMMREKSYNIGIDWESGFIKLARGTFIASIFIVPGTLSNINTVSLRTVSHLKQIFLRLILCRDCHLCLII